MRNASHLRTFVRSIYMKKERLFWLDFIRAIATFLIVLAHYNAIFVYNVYPPAPEKSVISLNLCNVFVGGMGVSLFLIISGASLMYVYGEKLEVCKFYKKRFLNIYPMFWIAYLIVFLYNFYKNGCIPQGIPMKNMIFSILGIDMWVTNFSVPNFGIVAEWFLGLIIIIYIIFPLLRWLINKYPVALGIGAVVMCIISINTVNKSVTLFARLPEFLLGMYFIKYKLYKKVNYKWAIPAALVLVLNTILKPGFNNMLQVIYTGISTFIVLVWISNFIKANWIKSICRTISKYSYACFIIHHTVIYKIIPNVNLNTISHAQSYLLFGYVCIMVCVATYLLYHLHDKIVKMLKEPYN